MAEGDLEERRTKIRNQLDRSVSLKKFNELLVALRESLHPFGVTLGPSHSIEEWYQDLSKHAYFLQTKDERLLLQRLRTLSDLRLYQLWLDDRFSTSSKESIWNYLQELFHHAKIYCGPTNPATKPQQTECIVDLPPEIARATPLALQQLVQKTTLRSKELVDSGWSPEEAIRSALSREEIATAALDMMHHPEQLQKLMVSLPKIYEMAQMQNRS